MKTKKGRKGRTLRDFILPHAGNGFKPLLLTAGGVTAIALLLILLEGAYLLDAKVAIKKSDFLASVLPSVLVDLTNQDRQDAGIGGLAYDPLLSKGAQLKANDMAAKGYFAHVTPDGKTPWYWFDQVAYPYTYAGENLAVNFEDTEDVEDAWMASPTHHANIVKAQYTHVGIGIAEGEYKGKPTTFVVQFFATPRADYILPDGTVAALSASQGTPGSPGQVLGAEIEPSFFAKVALSPTHSITYALSALAGFLVVLLLIAVFVHVRIQFLEVIVGGLLLILAALSLLVFNAANSVAPEVPLEQAGAGNAI